MLHPDLEALLSRVEFAQPSVARTRLDDLAGDPAELIALARLATEFGDSLSTCADPDAAINHLGRFVHARGARLQLYQLFADHPAAFDGLIQVLAASQYLADVLVRNPEYYHALSDREFLRTPRRPDELRAELHSTCAPFHAPEAKLDAVRRFRRRELLRIGAADLHGLADLGQTTEQLSCLADAVVEQCLRVVSGDGEHAGLIVFALGKLGGGELNYSSDIDLVFVTSDACNVTAATPLAQALTGALSEFSGEGFLYRVDLRLRPYGGSGALVVSSDMFEEYLATKAHPAERQAMLKARTIAGDVAYGREFLQRIAPVIFGDAASARQQVRELKGRIERQLRSRGHADGHVKLGPGGIRDVEFIVQAVQLEAGGTRPELRTGNTLAALARVCEAGIVSSEDVEQLRDAYVFLRVVEHRLQLMENQQVHHLPKSDRDLRVLARSLGFRCTDEVQAFRDEYERRVSSVRAIFERVLPGDEIRNTKHEIRNKFQ